MLKETIISVIIVISIVVLDFVTQDYTKKSTKETNSKLTEIKNSIKEKNIEANYEKNIEKKIEDNSEEDSEIKELVEEVFEIWKKRYDKLAYFIEHDELEKVETNLVNVKSHLKLKNFDMAISSIEETAFVLEHIEDKNAFNLKNIF